MDPVGKLLQMRQQLSRPPRPASSQVARLKTKPEPTRPKTPGPSTLAARRPLHMAAASGSARPKSARAGPCNARPRSAADKGEGVGAPRAARTPRDGRPSYRPAVGHGDLFQPKHQFLPNNNNLDTWDKNRCALPERAWPCQGMVATLYDTQRLGKPDWKRGDPRARTFGLALADVGTGIAAEQWIAHYVDAHQALASGTPRQLRPNSATELERPQSGVPAFKSEVTCPQPKHIGAL